MRARVVCGLSETIASFWPTMRFSSVDLPALGRPMSATAPLLYFRSGGSEDPALPIEASGTLVVLGRRPAAHAHARDAAPLHFQHFPREVVDLERLADVRHAAEMRQQVAAQRLEPLALDRDAQAIAHLVHAHLAAEDEHAVPLVGD